MACELHKDLSENTIQELYQLWNAEYPEILNYKTINLFESYLLALKDVQHHILRNAEGKIIGWAFVFTRDEDNWFGLIVASEVHNKKFGTQLLDILKQKMPKLNGWVVDHDHYVKTDGRLYRSPLKFYQKKGFEADPTVHLGFDKISAIKITWQKGEF